MIALLVGSIAVLLVLCETPSMPLEAPVYDLSDLREFWCYSCEETHSAGSHTHDEAAVLLALANADGSMPESLVRPVRGFVGGGLAVRVGDRVELTPSGWDAVGGRKPMSEFYVPSLDLVLARRYDEMVEATWSALTPAGEMRCAAEAEALGVRLLGSRALHRLVSDIERSVAAADVAVALDLLHDEGVVDLGAAAVDALEALGVRVGG